MKTKIENALGGLIRQPLWEARRVSNLACFDFGDRHPSTNKKGEPIEYGEFALHIDCAWRITHLDEIVVGSLDMYYPPDGSPRPPEDFKWDTDMGNLYDFRIKAFMEEHADQPLKVISIEGGRAGAFSVFLEDNYVLDIFPEHSVRKDHFTEHWYFLRSDKEHFTFTGDGFEEG